MLKKLGWRMSNQTTEKYEFKADMKQLLHIIIHSLYTHPEIFLRELISNASDALNKLRIFRLTNSDIISPEEELKITIELDKDNKVFSIEDTGIGMTKDDLIYQLGTIASSGTLNFIQKLKEQKGQVDVNLIGQFGVGFYSVFMVTDEVTIETLYAEKGSTGWKWVSNGTEDFTISPSERTKRGTKISFKLKEEYKEFAEEWKIKDILNKYSNFVDFPIYIGNERVNKVEALWHKKKEEVSEEELFEFYKFIAGDYQQPLGDLFLNIEGNVNFKAILFIPQTQPNMLFGDSRDKTLHLYSNKVFIRDDDKEILPEYLRFVKGVVDSEDIPLNVSREVAQSSPAMAKIRNVLTTKILNLLEEWAENDKEKYYKFYKNFGSIFKTGINTDFTNKNRIIELLRFETSALPRGEMTSLKEYVSRMKADQTEIYYISGSHLDIVEKNPNLEYFKKNNIEVLFLTDTIDIFTIPYIREYEGKTLKSIEKADIKIENNAQNEVQISQEQKEKLIEKFKKVLGDKVENVVPSVRLVNSPVTLVVGEQGLDPQLEKMMQVIDKDFTVSKRILEINLLHPIINNLLQKLEGGNEEIVEDAINQLYEGALLIEGYMKNPVDFVKRMNRFIEEATKI